jgi:WG repeat protein
MRSSPNVHLILAICFFSFSTCFLAQDAPSKENYPRCCYPIISEVNNKVGFIDETGRLVVPPTFLIDKGPSIEFVSSSAYRFSAGLAAVEVTVGEGSEAKSKWGFIDQKGQMIIAPTYLEALNFSEGLAAVKVTVGEGREAESKWGFIDQKGQMIIVPTYSEAHSFSEGLAVVKVTADVGQEGKSKWGFINQKGQMIIAPTYSEALNFSEGLAAIQLTNNRLGFIDKEGNLVVTTKFHFAYFTDTLIDSSFKGIELENSPYDKEFGESPRFSEGLYPIRVKRKWG